MGLSFIQAHFDFIQSSEKMNGIAGKGEQVSFPSMGLMSIITAFQWVPTLGLHICNKYRGHHTELESELDFERKIRTSLSGLIHPLFITSSLDQEVRGGFVQQSIWPSADLGAI